jgi:hypothetical protein
MKHGHATRAGSSRTYQAWYDMKRRCRNPRYADFHRYGGRGIQVCDRWQSFENFLADMGEAPRGLTLDRIDNDGNYEAQNCRWATVRQQVHNSTMTRWIEHNGERMPISEWAQRIGVKVGTLRARIDSGWSAAKALTATVRNWGRP